MRKIGGVALGVLLLVGCEELTEVGSGGYDMADVGVRQVELDGDLGPIAQLDGDVEHSKGVSCPGEVSFAFFSSEPEGDMRIDLLLEEAFPELEAGESVWYESNGENTLVMDTSVGDWTGEAIWAELTVLHLGAEIYEVGFASVILGSDGTESSISGHFQMDKASENLGLQL